MIINLCRQIKDMVGTKVQFSSAQFSSVFINSHNILHTRIDCYLQCFPDEFSRQYIVI